MAMFQEAWAPLQALWAALQVLWGALQETSAAISAETCRVKSSAEVPESLPAMASKQAQFQELLAASQVRLAQSQAQLGQLPGAWAEMSPERCLEVVQELSAVMESEQKVLRELLAPSRELLEALRAL